MPTVYRFLSAWDLPGTTPEAVWAAVSESADWPRWWPAVSSVEVLDPGGPDGVGKEVRYRLRAPLGYRLAVRTRVVEAVPPRLVVARVVGQLDGRGRWDVVPVGDGVRIDQLWEVSTTRRWMRLVAPVARPAFRWSHDRAARRGGEGLARWLAERG
jgi:Polyketide cyclase / dehydrase and lipid transport